MSESSSQSNETPLRIAIIGAGPSGFYAAEGLLKQSQGPIRVDMFDRLPTPYGLVRGGVAPDHQTIKNVTRVFERTASNPAFRFFGNVTLGSDLRTADFEEHYDQWVYAVGSARDRKLGIPGEDLVGASSATEFVGWYNGHPDFRDHGFNLDCECVAVVGVGNVAMDVTRILAQDPEILARTDIAGHAVDALRRSRVREIVVLGRRGVAQAAFSPPEIKEIGELETADLVVCPDEIAVDAHSEPDLSEANTRKNIEYLTTIAARGEGSRSRKVRLRFLVSPVEILGEDGRVAAVRLERNRLEKGERGVSARGTGEFETIPVGLVLRSVGYHGVRIPGVPFDEQRGVIPNQDGRVLDGPSGALVARQYVVGWAKRGPTGLIGTNRGDALATVQAMVADQAVIRARERSNDIHALLVERGVRATTFEDWRLLDRHEVGEGAKLGKIREKVTRVADMLATIERMRG